MVVREAAKRSALLVAVAAGYLVAFWLTRWPDGALSHLYTLGWTGNRLWLLLAPVTLALALRFGARAAVWSAGSYVAGVLFGELVGSVVSDRAQARLIAQLQDPLYEQDWEPTHPGWWIALLVFALGSTIGAALARASAASRPAESVRTSPVGR